MQIKFSNTNHPEEDCTSKFDEKKPLLIELDFENDMFTLSQNGMITVSGELSSADIISFSK